MSPCTTSELDWRLKHIWTVTPYCVTWSVTQSCPVTYMNDMMFVQNTYLFWGPLIIYFSDRESVCLWLEIAGLFIVLMFGLFVHLGGRGLGLHLAFGRLLTKQQGFRYKGHSQLNVTVHHSRTWLETKTHLDTLDSHTMLCDMVCHTVLSRLLIWMFVCIYIYIYSMYNIYKKNTNHYIIRLH